MGISLNKLVEHLIKKGAHQLSRISFGSALLYVAFQEEESSLRNRISHLVNDYHLAIALYFF